MEFINIKAQYAKIKPEIDAAIQSVINSGHFIMGAEVERFESELGAYLDIQNVISCGNGTDALQMIYMALGVGKGDAVFVPDMTFIATHEPACMLGAEAVFCDIDSRTYNISPTALEKQINKVIADGIYTPKCIVGVDFLGTPCDWDELMRIAKKYNLLLIEDAAQAMGAEYKGKKCGTFGVAAATSFFPTKPLGCYGDGGAVFTNNNELAKTIVSLRTHGKGTSKYDNVQIGVNSRLDTLQAAILSVKLRYLDEEIELRHKIACEYTKAFEAEFGVPIQQSNCRNAYAQYVLMARDNEEREAAMLKMKKAEVPSLLYYPTPMHKLPVFVGGYGGRGDFLEAEHYANCHFCLPFSPYLTYDEQKYIIGIFA